MGLRWTVGEDNRPEVEFGEPLSDVSEADFQTYLVINRHQGVPGPVIEELKRRCDDAKVRAAEMSVRRAAFARELEGLCRRHRLRVAAVMVDDDECELQFNDEGGAPVRAGEYG